MRTDRKQLSWAACALVVISLWAAASARAAGNEAVNAAATTAPSPAARLPAEAFFKSPNVLKARLSPSGRQLAFTSAAGASRVALAIVDLDGSGKVSRAALLADVDVQDFHWVNDQRLIFSVADLSAGSGEDRRAAPGLFGVNADGSELRQLIARKPVYGFVMPQPRNRETLPWFHVLLSVPRVQPGAPSDEVIVGKLDFDSDDSIKQIIPVWLNTRTGRTRSMDLKAPGNVHSWVFDGRGEARVATSVDRDKGRATVAWRAPGQPDWKNLVEGDLLNMPFMPSAVDESGRLYVTQAAGPEGHSVLTAFDFERKAPAAEPLVSVDGFDYNGVLLTTESGRFNGVRTEADAIVTVWFDEKMKAFQQKVDARFPDGINVVDCRRCGEPDMVALVRHFSDRDPGQIWVYRESGRQWQAVAQVMPGIDPKQMATVALERIKARDGRDLPVWLTLPPGRQPGRPGPAVVMVHGGPWGRGGHWQWQAMEQFLASRGYLVISPDFRGSTGYGMQHFKAGWKQWGQAMQDDVADALLWARQEGLADARVCIAGASYGGYSTLMGLVRHPELYRCGVAWVAVTDLFLMLEGSWFIQDDTPDLARQFTLPEMVGDARKDAAMLTQTSPLAQAGRIKAPLLLAFGEDDLRVPLAHGKRLRDALQKAGNDPVWITYPGEGHGWRLPKNQTDFATRVEQFLGQQLK